MTSSSASAPVLTSAKSLASISAPVGGVAVATTVFRTSLVSATSEVIMYVAVKVISSCTANSTAVNNGVVLSVVTSVPNALEIVSVRLDKVKVTFPSFLTLMLYSISSPVPL